MVFSEFKQMIREWIQLDYIVPEDIPAIELYMDQVTTFMDRQLAKNKRSEDDKTLTKTMINNYTKNNILPPPDKKKYSKNHIIILIYIYYLKNFLQISDIQALLAPMIDQYFDGPDADGTGFDSIYKDIFDLQSKEYGLIEKSLYASYRLADSKYDDKEDPYLHMLAFISILSYDIYAKKQLIESLIDNLKQERERELANTKEKADNKDSKKKKKDD